MTRRTPAVDQGDGRRCAWCGDHIDPIDWCSPCRAAQAPCGSHRRLRKRADAAFCDSGCRAAYRADTTPAPAAG
ncbi:hypothetical protein SACT1_1463 [Streptomyces sp. ACT-1]|nr:hypothetical protein SACT1_1463 [Streptomyces sp. ACT-1]